METEQRTVPVIPLVMLLLIVVVGASSVMAMASGTLSFTDHARSSHSGQVARIEKCFNDSSNLSNFYQQPNGRYIQYCTNNNRESYWRVYECAKDGAMLVITQFTQRFRLNTDRILKYIRSQKLVDLKTKNSPCFGGT